MELAQKDNKMEKSALSKGDIEKYMGKINATHLERETLDNTFGDDVRTLNQKYNVSVKKYHDSLKEIYKKREEHIQNIPKFWVTCLKNHPELEFMLGGKVEMECLNFLEKIEVEDFDCDQDGYQIKFHFMENPFFENNVLVKTVDPHGQTDASDARSTLIQWKKGKNLVRTQDFVRPRNGRRMIFPVQDTFFSWLADESTLPDFYAYFLKEHIWLNPVKYFSSSDDKDDSVDDEEGEEEEEEDSADGD